MEAKYYENKILNTYTWYETKPNFHLCLRAVYSFKLTFLFEMIFFKTIWFCWE